jgi:hypothetical protein
MVDEGVFRERDSDQVLEIAFSRKYFRAMLSALKKTGRLDESRRPPLKDITRSIADLGFENPSQLEEFSTRQVGPEFKYTRANMGFEDRDKNFVLENLRPFGVTAYWMRYGSETMGSEKIRTMRFRFYDQTRPAPAKQ